MTCPVYPAPCDVTVLPYYAYVVINGTTVAAAGRELYFSCGRTYPSQYTGPTRVRCERNGAWSIIAGDGPIVNCNRGGNSFSTIILKAILA